MTAPPVLLNGAPTRYMLDAGVFYIGSSFILYGNTVGGFKWDPADETRDPDWDGKRAPIEGQQRDIGGTASLTAKFLVASDAAILMGTPGAESDGSDGVNTITPLDNDVFWPEGAFQDNGLFLARRQDNTLFGVLMPRFYIKSSGFQTADKNETGVDTRIVPVIRKTESGIINVSEKPWRYLGADEIADLEAYLEALEA